jgi:hypothetical protein
MNSAKECVREYEEQYRQGLRTLPELITAIMRTAGGFGGKETIIHVSPEFTEELREQVAEVPKKEDFFVFKSSEAESNLVYTGLVELNNAIFRT